MAVTRHGVMEWPGVRSVIDGRYTIAHGMMPGVALLTVQEQRERLPLIGTQGNLIIHDNVGRIVVPDCKLDDITAVEGGDGRRWMLSIKDRRWKWRFGVVAGDYNVIDSTRDVTLPPEDSGPYLAPAQVYIPWTRRTPSQLMRLCLEALGERSFEIRSPDRIYPLPRINWDYVDPAQALSMLAESQGCVVVYRLDTDSILITPRGYHAGVYADGLPTDDVSNQSPGIGLTDRPDSIGLVGAPITYQCLLNLYPVAEEWNGAHPPLHLVSYRPRNDAEDNPFVLRPHIARVYPLTAVSAGLTYQFVIRERLVKFTATTTTVAHVVAGLKAALDALRLPGITCQATATLLRITEGTGKPLWLTLSGTGKLSQDVQQWGQGIQDVWGACGPPSYANVVATTRLTYYAAVEMAQKSVFKKYRVANVDPVTGEPGINVPGYGKLLRVQQLVLKDVQIAQVVPEKIDPNIIDRRGAQEFIQDYYDGMFKQKPARVYGRYSPGYSGLGRLDAGPIAEDAITAADQVVLVDFSIDANRQMVVFNEPVLMYEDLCYRPAELRLLTSFYVRNPVSNNVERYTNRLDLPPPLYGTRQAVVHRDDVEFLVKQNQEITYDANTRTSAVHNQSLQTNAGEVIERSLYYLNGNAARYLNVPRLRRTYNGIKPILLDGAVACVTWSVGQGGCTTQASLNGEHTIYLPDYPERARIEYLRSQLGTVPGQTKIAPAGAGQPLVNGHTVEQMNRAWTGKP